MSNLKRAFKTTGTSPPKTWTASYKKGFNVHAMHMSAWMSTWMRTFRSEHHKVIPQWFIPEAFSDPPKKTQEEYWRPLEANTTKPSRNDLFLKHSATRQRRHRKQILAIPEPFEIGYNLVMFALLHIHMPRCWGKETTYIYVCRYAYE